MVTTTATLLRRQGYHGTALQQVVQESGTPKGSLYHHFPGGKEELATGAIALGGRTMSNLIKDAFDTGRDLGDALDRFAELLAEDLRRSDFRDGCPVTTVALESGAGPVQEACAEAMTAWRARIERRLVAGGHDAPQARELSTLVLAAFEGALVLARALRDDEPLFVVARTLRVPLGAA
jgi:TetR/AcrR family transcriptional repressor of lmrAB and yxaGH operons